MPSSIPNPFRSTAAEFADGCVAAGVPHGRPGALDRYARLFREGRIDQRDDSPQVPPVQRVHRAPTPEGEVVKFTQRVPRGGSSQVSEGRSTTSLPLSQSPGVDGGLSTVPGVEIESVLIPMIGRKRSRSYTLCLSSQVGCAMGCAFCQTAQMGLIRSLDATEIVAQWFAARWLVERPDPEAPIRNIVFMGMGEPMDNLDQVIRAIAVLTDSRGPAVAMGRVTVSTVGRLDGISHLADQVRQSGWHRLGLAISLNAPNDEIRSRIMPINRSAPMADLRRALVDWPFFGSAHLCLEYVLIPGVNDEPGHADQLADFVLGRGAWAQVGSGPLQGLVNVIPYNPRENSPWPAPEEEAVVAFMARLQSHGVYVKRRRTKGRDTMSACGQLGNPALRRGVLR